MLKKIKILFDNTKLLKKYNTLESKYQVLKESIKEGLLESYLDYVGIPDVVEKLKEENTKLKEKNKKLKEENKVLENLTKKGKRGTNGKQKIKWEHS